MISRAVSLEATPRWAWLVLVSGLIIEIHQLAGRMGPSPRCRRSFTLPMLQAINIRARMRRHEADANPEFTFPCRNAMRTVPENGLENGLVTEIGAAARG